MGKKRCHRQPQTVKAVSFRKLSSAADVDPADVVIVPIDIIPIASIVKTYE
jgi:hypothetical protein